MASAIPLFSAQAVNAAVDFLGPAKRVFDSHWYILGKEVAGFEGEFAEYCGVANCVGVASGTDALELGLRALDVKTGDKVIVAANAGFYASTAVLLIGAIPHYVDIDPVTLTLSFERLQEALESNPKAIIVTHLYGQLADVETIVEVAAKSDIPVIEDCAQAHGAKSNGKRAGSFGTIGSFSFYPTKNLGACGDGGAIVTDNDYLAAKIRQLRQYGWKAKYHVELQGGRNSRLDEMQAAILREKLPFLDSWNAERREIARRYNAAFSDLPIVCPCSLGEDYVAHLYVVRVNTRDAFRKFIGGFGVATDVHYPVPDHMQSAYPSRQGKGALPVTERVCREVVTLPCYPGLDSGSIERVIQAVDLYFTHAGV
ncbi:MAG: DegT/DnrJ/EryC1/StrS family aminotransferase [Syntrophobacteraceae bacterium]|jgi:dTDP-4-amino-4,6-dideoxygalactose transaminase